jgi:hypothetical protein
VTRSAEQTWPGLNSSSARRDTYRPLCDLLVVDLDDQSDTPRSGARENLMGHPQPGRRRNEQHVPRWEAARDPHMLSVEAADQRSTTSLLGI